MQHHGRLSTGCRADAGDPVRVRHEQDERLYHDLVQNCLREYTIKHAVWSLAGSYRVRSGVQGMDGGFLRLDELRLDGLALAEGIDRGWKLWDKEMQPSEVGNLVGCWLLSVAPQFPRQW